MTRFTTTALALILASTPVLAESHEEGDDAAMQTEESMQNGEMENEQAMDNGDMAEEEDGDASEMAEADMSEDNDMSMGANPEYIRTRDITGGDIYTLGEEQTDEDWAEDQSYDAVSDAWEEIGEIEDVVLDRQGQMIGVVAEVGGFLDIGDKHVMLPVDDVRLVPVDNTSFAIVTQATQEELRDLEEIDEGFWN